jgi:hypothetical protein
MSEQDAESEPKDTGQEKVPETPRATSGEPVGSEGGQTKSTERETLEEVKEIKEEVKAVRKETKEGVGRIETKLENIEKKIEESTTLILKQMGLSKSEEMELRKKLTEELSGGITRLETVLQAISGSLSATGDTEGRNSAALLEASAVMRDSMKSMEKVGTGMRTAFDSLAGEQKETTKAFKDFTNAEYQQLLYQQGQLPPELQVPTIEIVAMRKLREEGKALSYEDIQKRAKVLLQSGAYERHILNWYKQTVREVESFNTTFEERPQHLSPLLLAVTHLELRPETRALGEKLRKNLDARRINKSMARVWDIALPEQIGGAASQLHIRTLKELFTSEDELNLIDPKTGKEVFDKVTGKPKTVKRYRIAEAFREYEVMGNKIDRLRKGHTIKPTDEHGNLINEYNNLDQKTKTILANEYGIDSQDKYKHLLDKRKEILDETDANKKRDLIYQMKITDGVEIRGDNVHFLGIRDYTIEERKIAEQRIQGGRNKGKYKELTLPEQADLKKFVQGRRALENILKERVNDVKKCYIEGGEVDSEEIDKKGNKVIVKRTIGERINYLEGQRDNQEKKIKDLIDKAPDDQKDGLDKGAEMLKVLRNRRKNGEIQKGSDEEKTLSALEKAPELKSIIHILDNIDEINREKDKLEDSRQAMIIGGGIYRYSFRGAKKDIPNGTGDFFAGRALNLTSRVIDRYQFAQGILDPVEGKYAGKAYDFGGVDYWENLFIDKAKKTVEETPTSAEGPEVRKAFAKRVSDKDYLEERYGIHTIKTPDGKTGLDLEDVRLEDPELWEDILTKYEVVDNWYVADQVDMYNKINVETRGELWKGTFFQDPNVDSFLSLKPTHTHLSDVSKKEKFGELADRTLQWFDNDPDAKEAWEELDIFPDSERFALIEEASKFEMMTNKKRDELFNEYLDFPSIPILVGRTPRGKAQTRVFIDTLAATWRWVPMRNQILIDSFWNALRRAFGYAFADEVGRG